jgi:hypothetical protein
VDDIVEINGNIVFDTNASIAGVIINTGSSLSGPYHSIVIRSYIENYGIWSIGETILD